jgi:CheY-like chemotaxis protein
MLFGAGRHQEPRASRGPVTNSAIALRIAALGWSRDWGATAKGDKDLAATVCSPDPAVRSDAESRRAGCSPLILVVDDDSGTVRTIEGILQRAGFATVSAANVEQALRSVREQRPDLVLLDVVLSDGSGFDVCRVMQSDPAASTTPVLFISAHDDVSTKVQGFHFRIRHAGQAPERALTKLCLVAETAKF